MQYVNCDDSVWQFSDREFKRQLVKVANGGHFDLDKGKIVARIGRSLEDINNMADAQYLLDYEFATKKQRDKRDMERHNSLIDCGLEKPMNDDQLVAFLSRG